MVTKEPPVVRAALCIYLECYFTLTFAILTTSRSLIIRTTIRMTIRERAKIGFIPAAGISPDYRPIRK